MGWLGRAIDAMSSVIDPARKEKTAARRERAEWRDPIAMVGEWLLRAKDRLGSCFPEYLKDIGCPEDLATVTMSFAELKAGRIDELPSWLPELNTGDLAAFVHQCPGDLLFEHPGTHLIPLKEPLASSTWCYNTPAAEWRADRAQWLAVSNARWVAMSDAEREQFLVDVQRRAAETVRLELAASGHAEAA